MTNNGTWLPVGDAAKAAGVSEKALRRRIERGTVESEMRDGRRVVLVESVRDDPAPRTRGVDVAPLLARLEQLATDNGRLRALTQIAESTEQRLTSELVEQRARVAELEAPGYSSRGAEPEASSARGEQRNEKCR